MNSHYDCGKQHNLRQFNLFNVKQCTEAPSNTQHASVQARVDVRAKAKRIKAYKCVAYAKKERKVCFLRQFNLLNVKQCTEAPSNIQHANIQARVYVRAKAKRIRAFKCEAYAKKERKICFQGNVKYRRVDRTVWNYNTMPLPGTLDPLECKNTIRLLNGTNNKILNNLQYNKTFTLLEDHYFQERLEQNVYRHIHLYACRQKLDL